MSKAFDGPFPVDINTLPIIELIAPMSADQEKALRNLRLEWQLPRPTVIVTELQMRLDRAVELYAEEMRFVITPPLDSPNFYEVWRGVFDDIEHAKQEIIDITGIKDIQSWESPLSNQLSTMLPGRTMSRKASLCSSCATPRIPICKTSK